MISPRELKAGNHVFLTSKRLSITIVKVERDTVVYETFPQNSTCSIDEISGIPLTPSLLRKLSFDLDKDNATWSGMGITVQAKPDGCFYGARINRNRTKITYVHELQNYFGEFFELFKREKRALKVPSSMCAV